MRSKTLLVLLLIGLQIGFHHESCPHPAFITKHLCRDCATEEDALEFSKPRKHQTGLNSVLAGNVSFEINDHGRCQNEELATVFECNLQTENCKLRGRNCTTYHNTGNGHMYYQNTFCTD